MKRCFIQTHIFSKEWKALGLEDNDLRQLELVILKNPKIGNVIKGTGKLRKMRFVLGNTGKSGGIRVCYVDFEKFSTVYLITAYSKHKTDTLSKAECNEIKKTIVFLEDELNIARSQKNE